MIALLILAAVVDPAWSHASLPAARGGSGATVFNGRLYVAGGFDATSGTADVVMAALGGDGSIGSFTALTSLPTPAGSIAVAVANGKLYVAGGNISEVDTAPVNADGTIGSFTATAALTDAPYGNGLVLNGSFLFSIGGAHVTGSGGSATTTFFSDVLSMDTGSASPAWNVATGLPEALTYSGVALSNNLVYVAGGQQATTGPEFGGVYASTVSGGGLTQWSAIADLPYGVQGAAAFVSGGFLFVVGGQTGFSQRNDVLQARILAPATLGAWITGTPLGNARYLHAAVANNGYAYVIGGYGGSYLQDIEYKKLTTPGAATKLVMTGAPAAAHVGDCIGPVTFSLQSGANEATWADADITLDLLADNGVWHSEATCGTASAVGQATIVGGTDAKQLWVYGTGPGSVVFGATAPGLGAPPSANLTLTPASGGGNGGGSGDDPHGVNGWGCGSAGANWLALLALLLAAKRHRRIEA